LVGWLAVFFGFPPPKRMSLHRIQLCTGAFVSKKKKNKQPNNQTKQPRFTKQTKQDKTRQNKTKQQNEKQKGASPADVGKERLLR
jgi:type III secretory pathway component EscV